MSGGEPATMPVSVNMADVARVSGVSIATVSRALRDVPGVSEPTSERVRRIAVELSYVISPEASRLAKGQTGRVAIVLPRLDAWFYSTMLASMESVLRDADLDVLVYQIDGEERRSRFLHELPARRKADAVVLTALPMTKDEMERLDLMGVHVVIAGGGVRDYPRARADDLAAGRIAVEHLIALGHRRIAMIRTTDTNGSSWSSDVLRVRAWREALDEAGLEPCEELLVSEEAGAEAGARAMARLLALAQPPTAVFAYSDELAFAAVAEARRAGCRVPEEISVIGVDGHPLGELLDLSTVDQDVAGQGRAAAELVVGLVTGAAPHPDVLLTPRLVARGSTAPPRR